MFSSISALKVFVNQLDEIENKSFDLWTWLPSSMITERYHTDYTSEYRPDPDWIMKEACELFSAFEGFEPQKSLQLDIDAPFVCECGETHNPGDDDHPDWSGYTEEKIRARLNMINSLIKLAQEKKNVDSSN